MRVTCIAFGQIQRQVSAHQWAISPSSGHARCRNSIQQSDAVRCVPDGIVKQTRSAPEQGHPPVRREQQFADSAQINPSSNAIPGSCRLSCGLASRPISSYLSFLQKLIRVQLIHCRQTKPRIRRRSASKGCGEGQRLRPQSLSSLPDPGYPQCPLKGWPGHARHFLRMPARCVTNLP